jgi:hypothetical protein
VVPSGHPLSPRSWLTVAIAAGVALGAIALPSPARASALPSAGAKTSGPVANFTAAINRLVELVGFAGGGILALVWTRVALSWFSNDLTKKIQAKDRARDALIGTLLFTAAVSGLIYGLAHWVITGS